jgi:hypothetical protein
MSFITVDKITKTSSEPLENKGIAANRLAHELPNNRGAFTPLLEGYYRYKT